MADKNGIVINVGFNPDTDNFINKVKADLEGTHWEKVVGLSESFDREFDKITKTLRALKGEVSELNILDVAKLNNGLNSVTQTANRLQKQVDALVVSLPVDLQAKMNKALGGLSNVMAEIGQASETTAESIANTVNAINNAQIDAKPYQKYLDAITEIQHATNTLDSALSKERKAGRLVDKDYIKDIDSVREGLTQLYTEYTSFSQKYRETGNLLDFTEASKSWRKYVSLLKDFGEEEFGINAKTERLLSPDNLTFAQAFMKIKKEYDQLREELEDKAAQIEAEALKLGYNLSEIMKGGVNDATRKIKGEDVSLYLPVLIDDESKEKIATSLRTLIEQTQVIANENPLHLAVDISSKYKVNLEKKTLNKIQEQVDAIQNQIKEAESTGKTDWGTQSYIAGLNNKMEQLQDLMDKINTDISKVYSIEIGVHTDWAAKQVSMFVEHAKEQLNTLKENVVLGPEINIDEDFQKRLEESTEKAIKKLEDLTSKISDSLGTIKSFFTDGTGLTDENFLQPEKIALGKLYTDLKLVVDEVNKVTDAFKIMRGEADEELKTGLINSLDKAINSISDSLGETIPKKLEITIKDRDTLEDALIDLKFRVDEIFETKKLTEWETAFLSSIKKIDEAFLNLLGTKDKVFDGATSFDFNQLSDIMPLLERVTEAASKLNVSLTGINTIGGEIKSSVTVDAESITSAIMNALNSSIITINTDSLYNVISSAISANVKTSTSSISSADIENIINAIQITLNEHSSNISEIIRSSIYSLDFSTLINTINSTASIKSTSIDADTITEAIRSAIDVSSITELVNTALKNQNIKLDNEAIAEAIRSSIDFTSIAEIIKGLPFNELQNSLQQIIMLLQIRNQKPEDLQSYLDTLDKEILEYTNKLNILKSESPYKPQSVRNISQEDQFPAINSISKAVVDGLRNTELNVNFESLREIISSAILDALLNKDSSVASIDGLSNVISSAIKEPIKPQSVSDSNLSNAISSGIQQAVGNGVDLIGYLAKDLALSDRAIIHNGRTIDKEDVEAILRYYGISVINGKASINKVAGKVVKDTSYKDVDNFIVKTSTEHGGILTNDLKLYGLSSADAAHTTAYSNPEIWRKAGVDISKGILSVIHSHAGDEFWVPTVGDFRNAIDNKSVPYSTTLARQEISVMDSQRLRDIFKNYTENDWDKLGNEIEELKKRIISDGFNKLPAEIKAKTDEMIRRNTYGYTTDPEAHKRNTIDLPAHYAATELILKKRFGINLNAFSNTYGINEFAKMNPYNLGSIVNGYYSSENSPTKPRSVSSSGYNDDSDIQAAIKINEEKLKELMETRELIIGLMKNSSNDQEINIAKMFDFSSIDTEIISSLTEFLKSFSQTITKLANDDSITKVSNNISTLTTAFTNVPDSNGLLKQLDSILQKSKELQTLSNVLKNNPKNINVVDKKATAPTGTSDLLNTDEKYIKELTSLYFSERGEQLFSIENLKATKDNLVEIVALIRNAEGEAKKVKLVLNNDATFTTKESKNAEKEVGKIEQAREAEILAAERAAEQALNRPNQLMDEIMFKAKQIPRVLNSAFNGNAVADQDITKTFGNIKLLFDELKNMPDELINKEKFSGTMTYLTGEIDTVINRLNKINTSNKDVAFNETLGGLIDQLKEIQSLMSNGKFEEATSAAASFAKELTELGGSQKDSVVVKVSQVDKLLAKINDELAKNPSMPRKLKGQFKDLAQDVENIRSQYEDGLVPRKVYDEAVNRLANLDKQAKGSYNSITSMVKRSAMSIARMYLSWYRWISYIRQGVTEVINMNTALTKMSYTMNVTDNQLKQMSQQMVQMAKDLSSSVANIQQIYQIYANLQTTQEELEKTARPTAILANLSGVDAATAADQIQAVLNQFELTADATEHIVDVYDKISASIKVDYSKGIASMAEAVQTVGNFANQAGLSFEQLAAIVGRVMQQTRQDGTAIGTALKTIMTRVSKASTLADDGEVNSETISQASAALKRFANIDVYTPTGEFREFDTVMTELAAKWNELTDAEQSNISFAIAATRQTATLRAVLDNWTASMNLATDATYTQGNAMANQQKYMDSIAGHVQSLKTELSDLWLKLLSSGDIEKIIDSVKELVISLQDAATGLKPVLDLLTGILSVGTKILGATPTLGIIATFLGLKHGSKLLTYVKDVESGIWGWQGALAGLTAAEETASVATSELTTKTKGLSLAFKSNPVGWIITALVGLVTIVNKVKRSTEEAKQKAIESVEAINKKYSETTKNLEEYSSKIQELQNKLNNENLSQIELYNAKSELIKIQKELIESYGLEADAIDLLNDKYGIYKDQIKSKSKSGALEAWQNDRNIYYEDEDFLYHNKKRGWVANINLGDFATGFAGKDYGISQYPSNNGKYDFNPELEALFEKYGINYQAEENRRTDLPPMSTMFLSFSNENINELRKTLHDFDSELSELFSEQHPELVKAVQDSLSSYYGELETEEIKEAEKRYNIARENLLRTTDEYYEYTEIVKNYNDALASGESDQIQTQKELIRNLQRGVEGLEFSNNKQEQEIIKNGLRSILNVDFSSGYHQILNNAFEGNEADYAKNFFQDYLQKLSKLNNGKWSQTLLDIDDKDTIAYQYAKAMLDARNIPESEMDYFKKQLEEYMVKQTTKPLSETLSYSKWLQSDSNVKKDKDTFYKNSELIDAYKSSLDKLQAYVKENPKEKINFAEVFSITSGDELFKELRMGEFETYMQQTLGDGIAATVLYAQDSFDKLNESLDLNISEEDKKLLQSQLIDIQSAALGVSTSITTIESSYWELNDVLDKVNEGFEWEEDDLKVLIDKYPELAGNVKTLENGMVTLRKEGVESLINSFATASNEAISSIQKMIDKYGEASPIVQGFFRSLKIYALEAAMAQLKTAYTAATLMTLYETGFKNAEEQRAWGEKVRERGDDAGKILYEILPQIEKDLDLKNFNLKETEDNNSKGSGSKNKPNEIDWIANSLENIQKEIDKTQEKYDRLFTTSGSNKALKEANKLLDTINSKLDKQIKGFEKAGAEYERELKALGLSAAQLEKVKNVALGNESAWEIERFKESDEELYDKLNEALKYYQASQDAYANAREKEHQQELNNIQKLQNQYDYLGAKIAKYEAAMTPETSIKKQQKYVTKLIALYDKQYQKQIEIAELKGDELEKAKLINEQEQKHNELVAQRSQIAIDDITTRYDRILSEYDNRQRILEHGIAMTEGRGAMVSKNYYKALIDNEVAGMDELYKERKRLVNKLNSIDTGSKEGLDLWWETKNKIDDVTASLYESEEAVLEWNKAIRQVEWNVFDRIQATIHRVAEEAEYLINGLSNKDLFEYSKEQWSNDNTQTKVYYGDWSDAGLATLGLHKLMWQTNAEQVEYYREQIKELNAEIKKRPDDLELIDRRNDLIEQERNYALAVENEKQAIIELVRDGYDKQLNSLQELTNKYMEALSAEKDLYDYQKSIAKKTKDLNNIRRQMAAYANDTSEEARSKIQQLTVQLQEAEEDLQDTQYDRYLSDQQKILDRLYNTFETYVDNKMDNRDALLSEMTRKVEENKNAIKKTLTDEGEQLNTGITSTMKNLWKENNDWSSIKDSITQRDGQLSALNASINSTDTILENYLGNYDLGITGKVGKIFDKVDNIDTNLNSITEYLEVNKNKLSGGVGAVYTPLNTTLPKLDSVSKLSVGNSLTGSIATNIAKETLSQLSASVGGATKNDINIQSKLDITLPSVKNYPEFVSELQKDKQFERMIQDMTVNKLTNKSSSLSKYKYVYTD